MNVIYGYNLTHEDLLYILKDLKAVYNGDFTMEELTNWIQKKAWCNNDVISFEYFINDILIKC